MSRAQNVTQEAVFAACDALMANNTRPTLENIRLKTGGSYSTLSPMLKAWRGQHKEQASVELDMPDAVLAGFKSAAAELWKAATSEAVARAKALEEEAERKVGEAKAETEELMAVVRELELDLAVTQDLGKDAEQRLAVAEQRVSELTEQLVKEQTQLETLKGVLEQQTQRNIDLEKELIELVKANKGKAKG